ncbi:Peroxiredoxin [Pedobacter hartonius]|uniref:Peroxiredoxin n=2 Tax=Pedobacter hartonius TaxID=425514 RepID=A0A1H4CT72_9SPHI|nr:Peroxiredoxin [Pedobacter hartonius]
MKKFIITTLSFVTFCLPLTLMAQMGYTITGKFAALNVPAKAYLVTLHDKRWKETDSVVIKNGKFRFTGKVDEPQTAFIAIQRSSGKRDDLPFYLENSNITFTAKDSIKNAVVSGSVSDKEDRELSALTTPFTIKITKIQNEFSRDDHKPVNKTAAEKKNAGDSIQSYVAQIRNIELKFIETHPNSFMALYTFNNFILNGHFNSAEVSPLFYKFSPQLQSSALGKLAIDRIISAERRGLGVKIIDFTQTDFDGKVFNITSLRGKYVLLDFWASWCYWCRAENPNVIKAYQQLKDRNLEIVSVSFDDTRASWEGAVKADKLPWLQVSDLKGMLVRDGLAAKLDITAIPQNLLINPEGVIIAANLRGEDLPAKLAALIK